TDTPRPQPTDAKAPREALRFHAETKGAQVRLDTRGCTAHRRATFHDGIVFSQRPVRLGEPVVASRLPTAMPWDLSNKAVAEPKATSGEECAICFYHAANTCLVPCGHTYFCRCCAWRVFRDTAKCPVCRWQIEAVAPAQGPPALRTEEGS
ncbi:hypothetical protein EGK_05574, partial [Macaca mulatta]